MDDLLQLQTRVEAARDRLGDVEADQRKYGLRLNDLVRIVEGALERQHAELSAAKSKAAAIEIELEVARNALHRMEFDLAARETDLAKANMENEQLRSMVMALLELVEGRNTTPMREAMVRLEKGVRHLLTNSIRAPAAPPAEHPGAMPQTAPRPVLVPRQEIHGRVAASAPAKTPVPEAEIARGSGDDAILVELGTFSRSNAEDIVKELPDPSASALSPGRRASSDAAD